MWNKNPYQRIAREVKNTKNYFLNWPVNSPIRLGDYGFYRGNRVEFDWQGNLTNFGIQFSKVSGNMLLSESCRSNGQVSVKFDTRSGTPASAKLEFRRKHSIAFESHGGKIDVVEPDKLHLAILEAFRDGKVEWNPNWVVVTQIYKVKSFSSFVAGIHNASTDVIANGVVSTLPFDLADPSADLSIGASTGMETASIAEQNALPYFVVSKIKGSRDGVTRFERYG